MFTGLEAAKRFFGEKALNRLLDYLRKDPINNLDRIFDLVNRAPIMPQHKEQIKDLRNAIAETPSYREYIRHLLTQTDAFVQEHLLVNFFINAILVGIPRQRSLTEKLGFTIPFTILIDPTSACNLQCRGCWAGAYTRHENLDFEEVDRIVTEAKELGIHFITMSGGEPFLWPYLFDLCSRHRDVAFMLYTNGTLIDEERAEKMRRLGNMSPAISLEGLADTTDARRGPGTFKRIMACMDLLREKGIIFGFSLTVAKDNVSEVFSDRFIDLMIEKGALYGWSFHYMPIGSNPDFSLMVTPEQRAWLVERVREIRSTRPLLVADFWNDGALTGGCIAGGRRYFHITAQGDVEPCAFIHFSSEKIEGRSLREILQSPLFKAYQKRQPFSGSMLRPCCLIDVPHALREIVAESGAQPTHKGADVILGGTAAAELDKRAEVWRKKLQCEPIEVSEKR